LFVLNLRDEYCLYSLTVMLISTWTSEGR
jgi:hypothetical protein